MNMKTTMSVLIAMMLVMSIVPVALARGGDDGGSSGGSGSSSDSSDDASGSTTVGVELRGDGTVDDDASASVSGSVEVSDDIVGGVKLRGDGTVDDDQTGGESGRGDDDPSDEIEENEEEYEFEREYGNDSVRIREKLRIRDRDGLRVVLLERREKLREAREDAGEDVEELRERLRERKENYTELREQVHETREEFVRCKDSNTTACKQVRDEVRQDAKPFLLSSADLVLEALENVRVRISASTDVNETQRLRLLGEIDARIATVEEAKLTIQDLNSSATPAQIREAARQIREAWSESKDSMHRGLSVAVAARIENIVRQTEQLRERLDDVTTRLEASGRDTSELEDLLEDFDEHLNASRDKLEDARDLLGSAPGGDAAQQANGLLRESRDELKELQDVLRGIVGELRADGDIAVGVKLRGDGSVDDEQPATA